MPRCGMPMLALPDNIWFPTSNGVEMCIDAYLEQVLVRGGGHAVAAVRAIGTNRSK